MEAIPIPRSLLLLWIRSHFTSILLASFAIPAARKMAGIRPPPGLSPGLPPPGLCRWDQRPIVGGLSADAEPFAPVLLAACISAGAAAVLQATRRDMAAAACALQLQAELEAMVVALRQDFTLADVEPKLARAAEAARAAGLCECETRCYDALMAACCRGAAIESIASRHIKASDEVGRRLIAAFGRDFSPGSAGEDINLWSRVVAARYHVYGGGKTFYKPGKRRGGRGRRHRADAVVVGDAVAWETEMVGAEDDLP